MPSSHYNKPATGPCALASPFQQLSQNSWFCKCQSRACHNALFVPYTSIAGEVQGVFGFTGWRDCSTWLWQTNLGLQNTQHRYNQEMAKSSATLTNLRSPPHTHTRIPTQISSSFYSQHKLLVFTLLSSHNIFLSFWPQFQISAHDPHLSSLQSHDHFRREFQE